MADTPRNVIMFLGDGMGIATVTAARIYAGQLAGQAGETHQLTFERFRHVALIKTFSLDYQVPDSASTMSAIMTGLPSRMGMISMHPEIGRGDCLDAQQRLPPETLFEQAKNAGMATGIVTTTRVTHATPAAAFAHAPDRTWEDDSKLSPQARSGGCRDIALQMVEFAQGDGIDVVLGGGRSAFFPKQQTDPEYPGQTGLRMDGRNLVEEWQARSVQRQFVWNRSQMMSLDEDTTDQILGLFEPSHMKYEMDRVQLGDDEPDIVEMTEFAIRRLSLADNGFFLLVEGGRIDHAHHENNAARALHETVMMDRAVQRALELTNPEHTLVLVTADHAHTLTISGYAPSGTSILGGVAPQAGAGTFQRPHTILSYANGPGYRNVLPDLSEEDLHDPDFQQFAGWPRSSAAHDGVDVTAYAHGLGADKLWGVIEQRLLHGVLASALFGDAVPPRPDQHVNSTR